MKKLTVLAASVAAVILLTACPGKPDEPQPLQLSDVVGRYEGTLTIDAEKAGDPAIETYTYKGAAEIEGAEIGGLDPERSFNFEWSGVSDITGVSSIYGRTYGELRGDTVVFQYATRMAYTINTSWGTTGLADRHGEYFDFIGVEAPVALVTDGANLSLVYADTVRDFVDVDGESCTIILRHTLRATRVR